jgi:hypothetical protein
MDGKAGGITGGNTGGLKDERRSVPGLLRQARWQLRRAYAGFRYGKTALENSPILFGNSFPKSGTHLLSQVLLAFPKLGLAVDRGMGPVLTFVRQTGRQRPIEELLRELQSLNPGDVGFGHVIAAPEILAGWKQEGVAHFFMIRDPRDVVISHAFYIGDKAVQNVHHEYYRSLPTLDDKIRASILGRPEWEGDFPDICGRYKNYLGWLRSDEVCILRYEDFINARQASLAKVLARAEEKGFLLRLGRKQGLAVLFEAIDPQRSFTFRGGRVGDWRSHFTDEHKGLFKEVAGDLLIQLGYEQDHSW